MATTGNARSRTPWRSLAWMFGTSGVLHVVRPEFFDRIVPRVLPGPARTWTYASGAAELTVAAGLVVPATRRLGGLASAVLLLAVWPANGQHALDAWRRRDRDQASARRAVIALVRLPLQVPLLRASLRVAR